MSYHKDISSKEKERRQHLVWSRRQQWLNLCGCIASLYVVTDLGEHFVYKYILQEQPFYRIFMSGTGLLFWVIVLIYYVRLLFFKRKARKVESVTEES